MIISNLGLIQTYNRFFLYHIFKSNLTEVYDDNFKSGINSNL